VTLVLSVPRRRCGSNRRPAALNDFSRGSRSAFRAVLQPCRWSIGWPMGSIASPGYSQTLAVTANIGNIRGAVPRRRPGPRSAERFNFDGRSKGCSAALGPCLRRGTSKEEKWRCPCSLVPRTSCARTFCCPAPRILGKGPRDSVARLPRRPLESPSVARWGPTALLSL
jgi:hypothetical protein